MCGNYAAHFPLPAAFQTTDNNVVEPPAGADPQRAIRAGVQGLDIVRSQAITGGIGVPLPGAWHKPTQPPDSADPQRAVRAGVQGGKQITA